MSEFLDIAYVASGGLKQGETVCLAAVVRGKKLGTLLIIKAAVTEERAI